jgi:aryl-alcohol dehydrogenase-like predicted oxidoreductase
MPQPPSDLVRASVLETMSDERRLDAVEQLVPLAAAAGLPMTHLAMAFAIVHPGVTSALLGPRTMEQLDDLPAGLDGTLSDEVLDRIDEIVAPGTDVIPLDRAQAVLPRAIERVGLRRRPVNDRAAA